MGEVTVLERQSSRPAFSAFKKQVWLAWLILPGVFLVLHHAYVRAGGPHYLGSKCDPDYAYICNSLNMAVGRVPKHVDHPGTSLQLMGAAVITLAHPFSGKAEKIDAVLKEPERHLHWINLVLAAMYASALALAGILVWRRTGNWQSALLLQASPFLLAERFRFVARVCPEPLLLVIGLVMATLLVLEVRTEHSRARALGILGFVAATGVITKINFFPLALVPLAALRSWKERGIFLLWTIAFGLLWLLPLGPHKKRFFAWVNGLAFNQGRYGYGEPGIIPPEYMSAVARLVTDNPWLAIAIGVSWLTALYGCIRWKHQTPPERRRLVLLGGLALAQTLEVAMAAKYGSPRYALPAFMFCALNLLLLVEYWGSRFPSIRGTLSGCIVVIVLLLGAAGLRTHYTNFAAASAAEMRIAHALENELKEEPKVFCWGSSSLYHALWFGNYWVGERYTKELTAICGSHPPRYLVHFPPGSYMGEVLLGRERKSFADLHALSSFLICGRGPTGLVMGTLPPNAKTEKVIDGGPETVTRVTLPKSSE